MTDRWEIPKILVISTKIDRFAGTLVAIGEILLISYGVRTETERLRVLVQVIPKISQISWLCVEICNNKMNTYTSSTPGLYCKEQTVYIVYCLKHRVRNVNLGSFGCLVYANSSVWCTTY